MTLPPPIVFAVIGYCTVAITVAIFAGCLIGWAFKALRSGWGAVRASGLPRPTPLPRRIPAPPAMVPRPDLEAALRADIEARLRALDNELRNDPDYHLDVLDRLFADGPHAIDR